MCETTTNSSSYSSVKVEVVDDEAEQQLDETTTEADTNTPPAPSFHAFISLSRNEWPMLGVALLFMTAAEVAGLTAPLLLSDCYGTKATGSEATSWGCFNCVNLPLSLLRNSNS